MRYHWWLQREMNTREAAKAVAAQLVQGLQEGVVPDTVPKP